MTTTSGAQRREILFEFAYQGSVVRVSAIDPYTNTEVSMVGDPRLTEASLKAAALRKLKYVLRRDGKLP
ncbi:hypothetical protein F1188_17335 [Roseospira marina]|uniref:DUF6898 domain-containing protein n=2 Tax=Roseospira marina TaxID=140057 RepID=A0A5M6I7P3_9PROT|nr:hypothetical protein [Roseospira marina]KAA5604173.1 hypothetical protein F1188_17335 [Roseospira marina]MBB5088925.1 hypothetical protein [Roseospira marina]